MKSTLLAGLVTASFTAMLPPASAQVDQILNKLEKLDIRPTSASDAKPGLSSDRIGSGLREALRLATEKTVQLTGHTDGYFGNPAIRIPMPPTLERVEKAVRMVGGGSQADAFILSMNRAAEQSAPAARRIFLDAVASMTFDDARRILAGGNTAATDFFRSRTTDQLTAAFTPIVKRNMDSVGVTRQFQALMTRFESIPFMQSEAFDLDGYVVAKAMDGLFEVIGEQEKEIRANPVARTTELVKEVFDSNK